MEPHPNTDAQPKPTPAPPPAKALPVLPGVTKVAALLLTMDRRLASRLLKHFDEDDIKLIAQTASDLGTISKPVLDSLIEEFASHMKSGGDLMATADEVEELLMGVVAPDQISEIMSQVRSKSLQSIWVRLSETPEANLGRYLAKEHPQVGALVLSRAAPAYAAAVLRLLPAQMRNEVMRRMLAMKPIQERPLKLLEEAFKEDVLYNTRNSGPTIHARLADIINKMDRKHMDEVLRDLEAHAPKEAEIVRSLLFTFDDIAKLNQSAMLALFDQVPPERTIAALHGADARLRDLILEAVPGRARRMIEQEIATGKKPLTKEISKARRAIADLAMELMEKGVIDLNAEDEEAEA
jgi:flagellar motor switch protein FliG